MARYLEASSGRDAEGGPIHSGHPSPMLSLEECLDQRQVCLRAGTLGKDPQSVAMVDGECRLALEALQSHGAISP
jgi:hypothetical protein